ncbi:uncharacterized protein BDZ99DRAFT_464848 [Mytilinidion resinicola]|uniref:Uncharacterized protein n=1 Tax=Mytilinidion resinicola TaxID=574789 RepID=A0A6A6YH90_9PEZI|nr:uncharacterized protein BDZ99DRAFT_464848 [Mytilinidion resinicola]KAF2807948.1 hypothetical protein BDZ99DRAFT_464848 [Mytilinidion resinicola]
MLARSVVVFCGDYRVDWSRFEEFFRIAKVLREKPGEAKRVSDIPGSQDARAIINEKAEITSGQRLEYILDTFEGWQCEKPQDKVYGLLGLVPEHRRVPIDYQKSLYEIFTDVIHRVVHDESHLDVGSHITLGRLLKQSLAKGESYSKLSSLDVEHYVRMVHAEQRTAKQPPHRLVGDDAMARFV